MITHTTHCPTCHLPTITHNNQHWTLPLPTKWHAAIKAAHPTRPTTTITINPPPSPNLLDLIPTTATITTHHCGPQPPTTAQTGHLPPF